MTMLMLIFLALLVTIFLYISRKHSYWSRKGVDSIKPDFFFGNTTDVIKRKEHRSIAFENFYKYFKSRGQKFGGIYDLISPVFVVTDLELIKCVLQKDFSHFMNHFGYINEEADPVSGSLFNLKDGKWKNIRAKLTPTFTTGKMKMMFETIAEYASNLQELLEENNTPNNPVDIKKYVSMYNIDIITNCAFGIKVNSMKDPNTEFIKYFEKLMEPSLTLIIRRFISVTFPQWLLVKLKFRVTYKNIEQFFLKTVKDIVEFREKNNVYRKDFMHLLIQIKNMGETTDNGNLNSESTIKHLSINEIAAQAITFYVAGYETSSSTMAFGLMELALNIEYQDRLREEILSVVGKYNNKMTYDGIMEMEYLDMVVQETMRLYPIASGVSRVCNKPYPVPGTNVVIETGTEVMIPLRGLHRDPEFFPDPDKFDPERFNPENKNGIRPYTYMPFGEGPRACIGLRFGKLQVKVGICAVILKYKLTINKRTQFPLKLSTSIIAGAVGGIWLDLEKISDLDL